MLPTAGPRCKQRFMSTLDTYFQSIMQQAADRASNNIPELEEYIALRRDTSGCRTGFALIEYATHIDLPDEVAEHPILLDLLDATNDIIRSVHTFLHKHTGFNSKPSSWINVSNFCDDVRL